MAIIVEDGSGVLGANSYINGAGLDAYGLARGISFVGDKDVLLTLAALYIEQLPFIGDKKTKAQPIQWPRYNATIDRFNILSTEIPQQLIDLQCEVAIAIGDGDDPLSTVGRAVKREKVDTIEVEYADNAAPFAYNRKIKALEKKLTTISGGLSFRIDRG